MSKNKIIKKIYLKGEIELQSPVMLSSGEDELTDSDFIRDWDGNFFLPGTSIAGTIRHFFEDNLFGDEEKKIVECFFGMKAADSKQSLINVYDAFLSKNSTSVNPTIRDGVKLDNLYKTAEDKSKYDYEVIEPGNRFVLRLELTFRKTHEHKIADYETLFYQIIDSLQKERIRIGAKTRRGFGKIKLIEPKLIILDLEKEKADIDRWINFDWETSFRNGIYTNNLEKLNRSGNTNLNVSRDVTKIKVLFDVPYSIIIRHYNIEPEKPDSTHITSSEKPVVTGTSWTGAIRHAIENAGRKYEEDTVERKIENLFGFVKEKENKAKASKVFVEETKIEDGVLIPYRRNKIDRFTGGTFEGALFDESPSYGGQTQLDIEIIKPTEEDIGFVLLAVLELAYGIQTVGGGSNVGRGILNGTKIFIDDNEYNVDHEKHTIPDEINEYIKKIDFKENNHA